MVCESRHQHTEAYCRKRHRRITYTTTHVVGDGIGGLLIQLHTLQETAQEGYSYSHTCCSCRFLLSSRPDPFSGAIHPFLRPFLPTARSVAAAMQYVPRPRLMCTTAAVRTYCGRRTPAQQEKRNKKYVKKGAS